MRQTAVYSWVALAAVSIVLTGGSTRNEVTTDRVDLVEVNHYYDEQLHPVLQQLIFYDWCRAAGRYQVRDFRIIKSVEQIPCKVRGGDAYVVMWLDEHDGIVRRVVARTVRRTYTQYDPEMMERDHYPKEQRRELTPPLRRR